MCNMLTAALYLYDTQSIMYCKAVCISLVKQVLHLFLGKKAPQFQVAE